MSRLSVQFQPLDRGDGFQISAKSEHETQLSIHTLQVFVASTEPPFS